MTWLKLGLVGVLSIGILAACVKKEQPEHEEHAASEVQQGSEQAIVLQEQPSIEEIPSEEPAAKATIVDAQPEPSHNTTTQETNIPAAVEVTTSNEQKTEQKTVTAAQTNNTSDEDPLAQVMKAAQPALKPAQPAAEQ